MVESDNENSVDDKIDEDLTFLTFNDGLRIQQASANYSCYLS